MCARQALALAHSNVPLLIILHPLYKYEIVADNIQNVLYVRSVNCEVPHSKNFWHLYVKLPTKYILLYTYTALKKLHENSLDTLAWKNY